MSDIYIDIQNLSKRFGGFCAVDDISFQVKRGEVVGFLGPNGAGKTTTMRMLSGFLPPSAGTAHICGYDAVRDVISAQKSIGYLPEGAPLYPDMTPHMMFHFIAELRGLSVAYTIERIEYVRDILGLGGVMNQAIDTLSKGFKRRAALACALLHDPDVLVLDEPTDGLDPNQKHDVRTLIKTISKDKAILISTHILEEVDAVCDRAVIIANGRVVANDTPANIMKLSVKNMAGGAKTFDDVFRDLTRVRGDNGIKDAQT